MSLKKIDLVKKKASELHNICKERNIEPPPTKAALIEKILENSVRITAFFIKFFSPTIPSDTQVDKENQVNFEKKTTHRSRRKQKKSVTFSASPVKRIFYERTLAEKNIFELVEDEEEEDFFAGGSGFVMRGDIIITS